MICRNAILSTQSSCRLSLIKLTVLTFHWVKSLPTSSSEFVVIVSIRQLNVDNSVFIRTRLHHQSTLAMPPAKESENEITEYEEIGSAFKQMSFTPGNATIHPHMKSRGFQYQKIQINSISLLPLQWRIQDFRQEGAPTPKNLLFS